VGGVGGVGSCCLYGAAQPTDLPPPDYNHTHNHNSTHTHTHNRTTSYEVRSPRRIALTFLEAQVGRVKASPLLETLLAPALLPRGWWNLEALQGLREVRVGRGGWVRSLG